MEEQQQWVPDFAELPNRADALPEPYGWLVDYWIPLTGVTNYSGHGESGKTYTMLDLMLCALMGRRWLGLPVKELDSVCFLTAEQSLDQIDLRLDRLLRRYGYDGEDFKDQDGRPRPRYQFSKTFLQPNGKTFIYWSTMLDNFDEPFVRFNPFAVHGQADRYLTQYFLGIVEALKQYKSQLFIIDTILHFFFEQVNDKERVIWFLKQLKQVAEELQISLIFLYHPSKAGIEGTGPLEGMGGVMDWHNQVDARLLLIYEEEEDGDRRLLKQKKGREAPRQKEIELCWDGHGFAPPGSADKADGYEIVQRIIADCNRSGLLLSPKAGIAHYSKRIYEHPLNVWKGRKAIYGRNHREGQDRVKRLVEELMRRGMVAITESIGSQGRPFVGISLTEMSPHFAGQASNGELKEHDENLQLI